MKEKSTNYKEAKNIAHAILKINLLVGILNLGNLGLSTRKTDKFGGHLKLRKIHFMNADPRRRILLINCRKRIPNS